ncbi:D-fructose-6-phosphate amidotransferase, partial [Vibrio parahaemolyticus]|nr:D-fructose-6-phosphate amidotransferase [Vibrio parahaemolyticus]
WEHQDAIAQIFFHESFYFIAFLIPPFFLWKIINRSDLVTAAQNYIALKLEAESR